MKDMKQFKLWITADLKERIDAAAKKRGWSANREAVDVLMASFPLDPATPSSSPSFANGLSFEDRLAILKAGIRPASIEMHWLMHGKI